MTLRHRAAGLLGGLALAVSIPVLTAAPASADPVSSCSSGNGAVVAVDFSHWGGPVVGGCDTSAPSTGYTLLTDEGFRMAPTQHDGPAFVCRIGNQAFKSGTQYPTAADEPCVQTPPASAYWSYWIAKKGANSWSYSQWGAMASGSKPSEGEVQLWIFGGTDITGSNGDPTNGFPVCTPNAVRAGSPGTCTPTGSKAGKGVDHYKPRQKTKHAASGSTRQPTGGGNDSGGGSRGSSRHSGSGSVAPRTSTSTGATAGSGAATSAAASEASSAAHSTGAAPASSASSIRARAAGNFVDAKPASTKRPPAGSPAPLLTGIGLAVVLAIGGGWAVWRRRRLDADA